MSANPRESFAAHSEFTRFLEAQRAQFASTVGARIERIARAVEAAALAELEREAHSLAGSGGTFGFVDVGRAARALELAAARGAHAEELAPLLAHLRRSHP